MSGMAIAKRWRSAPRSSVVFLVIASRSRLTQSGGSPLVVQVTRPELVTRTGNRAIEPPGKVTSRGASTVARYQLACPSVVKRSCQASAERDVANSTATAPVTHPSAVRPLSHPADRYRSAATITRLPVTVSSPARVNVKFTAAATNTNMRPRRMARRRDPPSTATSNRPRPRANTISRYMEAIVGY